MNDFEDILDDCVEKMTRGTSTLEECLSLYPQYAAQLRPLLQSTDMIRQQRGRASISPLARARGRAKLTLHMKAHPHPRAHLRRQRVLLFQRLAIGLAVMMFALLSVGTVRAQSALPSDLFYTWKLVSERIWRGMTFNTSHVDLVLADRRVSEIVATADDPTRRAAAVHDYEVILTRLESGVDRESEAKIFSTLETHQKSLKDAGLSIPQLDDYLRPRGSGNGITPELPKMPLADPPSGINIPSLIP